MKTVTELRAAHKLAVAALKTRLGHEICLAKKVGRIEAHYINASSEPFITVHATNGKELAKVLKAFPYDPSKASCWSNGEGRGEHDTSTVKIESPYRWVIKNNVRDIETRVEYNTLVNGVPTKIWVNFPTRLIDQYTEQGARGVDTSTELHYFGGVGRSQIGRVRISTRYFLAYSKTYGHSTHILIDGEAANILATRAAENKLTLKSK